MPVRACPCRYCSGSPYFLPPSRAVPQGPLNLATYTQSDLTTNERALRTYTDQIGSLSRSVSGDSATSVSGSVAHRAEGDIGRRGARVVVPSFRFGNIDWEHVDRHGEAQPDEHLGRRLRVDGWLEET